MSMSEYSVRAAHCDHRASEDEIYETMSRITSPLERSWQRIENARRVVIKRRLSNQALIELQKLVAEDSAVNP